VGFRPRLAWLLGLVLVLALLPLVVILLSPGKRVPARPFGATGSSAGAPAPDATSPGTDLAWRFCLRVIDGDTIVLDGNERVRLIGVDTPETVHPRKSVEYFGREASAFTHRLVEGRRVRLEYDQDLRDRYGRTLAYVFLEDGRLVNAEIIRQGFGFAYTKYAFRRMEEFRACEREARATERGLWHRS
jgi:micrococcal nuclease